MIQYIGDTLEDFPGASNQTRCFVHTVNLIAKSILKPFDERHGKKKDIQSFNDAAHALAGLAEEHDPDECTESMAHATGDKEEEGDKEKGGDLEDEEEDTRLEPIRSMLLKVCLHSINHNPELRIVESSSAKLRLHSRTRLQSFFQHGTQHCLLMGLLHV